MVFPRNAPLNHKPDLSAAAKVWISFTINMQKLPISPSLFFSQ